jgi:hypothetical protein
MAFSSFNANLSRATGGNDLSPTMWTYQTTDSLSTVCTSGYFNAAANRLKVGDLVFITSAASPWLAGLAIVKSNTRSTVPTFVAGVVDLFNATVINVTINSA